MFITFVSRSSRISHVHDSTDRDSNSEDEMNFHESFDDDHDVETQHEKLLGDSVKLTKINEKKTINLKHLKLEILNCLMN